MIKNPNNNVKKIKEPRINNKDIEKNFLNLLDNFPLSIFLLKSNKLIYDCNRVAELYLNKSKEDLIEKNFFDLFLFSEEKLKVLEEIINNVINFDLSEIIELEYQNFKNEKAWIELYFSSLKIDNKKFIQIILQDITEKKLADNIIKEENKKLRELDLIKKQLTAKTSEELKSPLEIMSNASKLLLNTYKDKLDQNAIQLLELIKNGGERSMNLVGRILNISKIESNKIELNKQTESIIEIIRKSVEYITSDINTKKIILNLELSEDLYSEVDRIRIEQSFKDFLLEIVKITPKNGKISISSKENKNSAEILIKTNGSGLKQQETSLELQFLKEIIERHGGQITIASGINNKGTNFLVQLPIKNWRKALIHIYIIYKSGIPLYDYSFTKTTSDSDASLISGGIIGLMTILKAIIKGEKKIKTIDHGDRKILFESNVSDDIIFVLMAKENLIVFKRKLDALIKEFDKKYDHLIDDIENTHSDFDNWSNLELLIKKYFGK
ncbi:MAG: PAS domain-containing protein [Promethearchaeota archaeon]